MNGSEADDDSKRCKISERAYAIWLEEGQPEGKEKDHWDRAAQELGYDTPTGKDDRLDQGLEESFPASDPASEVQPGGGITGPGDH